LSLYHRAWLITLSQQQRTFQTPVCIIRVIALKRQQANTTLAVLEGNLAGSDALLAGNDLIQGPCRCQQ